MSSSREQDADTGSGALSPEETSGTGTLIHGTQKKEISADVKVAKLKDKRLATGINSVCWPFSIFYISWKTIQDSQQWLRSMSAVLPECFFTNGFIKMLSVVIAWPITFTRLFSVLVGHVTRWMFKNSWGVRDVRTSKVEVGWTKLFTACRPWCDTTKCHR